MSVSQLIVALAAVTEKAPTDEMFGDEVLVGAWVVAVTAVEGAELFPAASKAETV